MSKLSAPDSADYLSVAELLAEADSLLITAGAGMSIDSGLPDFRGEHGFWRAYPALGRHGLSFYEIASPRAFRERPELAWGFYGHRLQLYRKTVPHQGYAILRELTASLPLGGFVFTSNVDGHFQSAGFDPARVAECHGTIHMLQCLDGCGHAPWSAQHFHPLVDKESCQLQSELPRCPACGALARPNILMFSDGGWDGAAVGRQVDRLERWLGRGRRSVVLEIGAGTAIPTVRRFGEEMGVPLVRLNPDEAEVVRRSDIGLAAPALRGLQQIRAALATLLR
ncbi:SIR2 family NAD-dependent protein deacylase [Duganella qianjiadongensis]|uniref:protein acetyllysine N-acetyltransferase n=1 Tax=Duganella qianjiadongensis TaxID=2692176 RepID=A0ABW9VGE1_9BURK|nr:Sir2 family NAD-dependent protein deacetylase [Duganella qianjiadongensis]MYM37735.1 NAD-dependent deacetylase [Duganella qianjiadongensis]